MELDDKTYEQIMELSDEGNELIDEGKFHESIEVLKKALNLIPQPKDIWEASTWIYATLGDASFLANDYEACLNYMFEALKCPGGIGNPFILLRIGQCFFELDNMYKAKEYLLQAYMLEGEEIFEPDDEKYFELIKGLTEIKDDVIVKNEIDSKNKSKGKNKRNKIDIEIEKLIMKHYEELENKNYENAIHLLIEAWDKIPNNKYEHPESYNIVMDILNATIEGKYVDIMLEWADKIFYVGLNRFDTGDREMWAGKVAYEIGEKDKALEYFRISVKKSEGRCFYYDEDLKYKQFFIEETIKEK